MDSNETITLNGQRPNDLGIVDEGGVAVDRGKIVEAASSQLLERKYTARRRISAHDQIVLPGFVDPHTHLVFRGGREDEFQLRLGGASYLEILKRGGGIMETVRKTAETTLGELVSIALRRLNSALELGTTTIEIKTGYGLRLYEEMKMLKAIQQLKKNHPCHIVSTFLGAHAIPAGLTSREAAKVVIESMVPAISREHVADFCDVFCEEGVFDTESSRRILKASQAVGLRSKIHADQFTDNGGARVANEVTATSADHLVHSNLSELEKMKRTSVTPVVLPGSSLSLLGEDRANAKAMLSMGLGVALGSDFSPSNWIIGPLTVAAIASRELRMNAEEIIPAITINAAKALNLQQQKGSLSSGKSADIVLLNAPSYKWISYTYGEKMVDKVLIAGEELVSEGRLGR